MADDYVNSIIIYVHAKYHELEAGVVFLVIVALFRRR